MKAPKLKKIEWIWVYRWLNKVSSKPPSHRKYCCYYEVPRYRFLDAWDCLTSEARLDHDTIAGAVAKRMSGPRWGRLANAAAYWLGVRLKDCETELDAFLVREAIYEHREGERGQRPENAEAILVWLLSDYWAAKRQLPYLLDNAGEYIHPDPDDYMQGYAWVEKEVQKLREKYLRKED